MSVLTMTREQYDAHQARVKSARVIRFEENETEQQIEKKRKPEKVKPAPRIRKPRPKYEYEKQLALQLTMKGFREFEVDVRYLPTRLHRADILFRKERLVVEIQGACHRIRGKWQRDIEKAQLTVLAGFRLLPVSTRQVKTGVAADIVRKAIDMGSIPF